MGIASSTEQQPTGARSEVTRFHSPQRNVDTPSPAAANSKRQKGKREKGKSQWQQQEPLAASDHREHWKRNPSDAGGWDSWDADGWKSQDASASGWNARSESGLDSLDASGRDSWDAGEWKSWDASGWDASGWNSWCDSGWDSLDASGKNYCKESHWNSSDSQAWKGDSWHDCMQSRDTGSQPVSLSELSSLDPPQIRPDLLRRFHEQRSQGRFSPPASLSENTTLDPPQIRPDLHQRFHEQRGSPGRFSQPASLSELTSLETPQIHPDLLRKFHEQRSHGRYSQYVACWNIACMENPSWLVLRSRPEGWISPWCQVCSNFGEDHLWTSKCRDRVAERGLTPGPFLQSLLANKHALPQLTEDQFQMPPSMILPAFDKPARNSTVTTLALTAPNVVHQLPLVAAQPTVVHQLPLAAVPTVAQAGAHNVVNQLPAATAVSIDQFLADQSRQYRCANPRCNDATGPFLINPDPRSGGYCCKNCFDHHASGMRGTVDHGPFCRRILAPGSAPQAPPVVAQSLRSGASQAPGVAVQGLQAGLATPCTGGAVGADFGQVARVPDSLDLSTFDPLEPFDSLDLEPAPEQTARWLEYC